MRCVGVWPRGTRRGAGRGTAARRGGVADWDEAWGYGRCMAVRGAAGQSVRHVPLQAWCGRSRVVAGRGTHGTLGSLHLSPAPVRHH